MKLLTIDQIKAHVGYRFLVAISEPTFVASGESFESVFKRLRLPHEEDNWGRAISHLVTNTCGFGVIQSFRVNMPQHWMGRTEEGFDKDLKSKYAVERRSGFLACVVVSVKAHMDTMKDDVSCILESDECDLRQPSFD